MLLNELSVSFKCHSSIGNSLDLTSMMEEVIRTFMQETYAIYGASYLLTNGIEKIISIGKEVSYNIDNLPNKFNDDILIEKYNTHLNILYYKLENALIVFIYDKNINLNFIIAMYKNFKRKLNLAIDSCLNVMSLEKKNYELNILTNNLKEEVKKEINLNKEKERQISEQLKIIEMGELIGNIAHQWRQPLSAISTLASGMQLKKEMNILNDKEFFDDSNSIIKNTQYLSDTIDEFREYIKQSHRKKDLIIQKRFSSAIKIVTSSYKEENIKIIEEFMEPEPLKINLIAGELLQVFLSILDNAKDALKNSINEVEKWVKYSIKKSTKKVFITIEDNAGGINEKIKDKIFNPYFTTKHQSQGTGIGLYNSYDIVVNRLFGKIYVENTKNGARFIIELPLIE
ncbi:MAG: sensor histidine kinase [Poseidonibacter sp.]|uniref:sensor histidine kinase n=1 Tax=Poseidonibacter sp. TaxID=2321188 RepID=UPI00359D6FC9